MTIRKITDRVPKSARVRLLRAKEWLSSFPYYGRGQWCPVCGRSSRRFREAGSPLRAQALCVHCGALERHRFVWLYLLNNTNLFDGRFKKVLHVAPERCLQSLLKQRLGDSYVTADLRNPDAAIRMDITNIQYPQESFDVIYCSHVLEHVQEDRLAMMEFRRVLKWDGWAILLVPITAEHTFEDPRVVDPLERRRLFGEADHVRRYGPDFVDRLRDVGFSVSLVRVPDLFTPDEVRLMGLTPATGDIFCCRKQ